MKDDIAIGKKADSTYRKPITRFFDNEFADNVIDSLDLVVEYFGTGTATVIVKRTQHKNSNWYTIAKIKELLNLFENQLTNSSDEKIDLTWHLDERGKDTFV